MGDSRILVAVSSPWASDKLFTSIRDLAGRLGASIVVAHVAQAGDQDETPEDARLRGEQTLRTLTGRLTEENVPAEGVLLFGDDVARAVLNAARAHKATLIVIGLSAKSRVARLFAGDVPQQIIKQARLPVLLYPADWCGMI